MAEQQLGTIAEEMPEIIPPPVLNEVDAAKYLGMSPSWVRQARMHGTGPEYIRIGRTIRYPVPDLDKFLETHRIKHPWARQGRLATRHGYRK